MQANGEVSSAGMGLERGKAGGRPNVTNALIHMLLDIADNARIACVLAEAGEIRAGHFATAEIVRLYRGRSSGTKLEHPPVDGAVRRAFPRHRPDERAEDIVRLCRNEFLEPFELTREIQLTLDEVTPGMVPTIRYGAGPVLVDVLSKVGARAVA